jgi:hypothetical protein
MKKLLQITVRIGFLALFWLAVLLIHQYAKRFFTLPEYWDLLITGQSSLLWAFLILTVAKDDRPRIFDLEWRPLPNKKPRHPKNRKRKAR